MATADGFDASQTDGPRGRTERLVIVGADRSRMFRKARRHTLLVKSMRLLLPTMTLSAVGLFVASALSSANFSTAAAIQAVTRILPENLTMHNPHYDGFTGDGGTFEVRAATANQDLDKPKVIKLNGITGKMTDAKDVVTHLKATRGTFHTTRKRLNLYDGIDVTSDDGMKARLEQAVINVNRKIIVSKKASVISMPNAEVRSNMLKARLNEKIFDFSKQVRTTLTPDPEDAKEGAAAAPAKSADNGFLSASSGEPIVIDSSSLSIDRGKQNAQFKGKVKAAQGDQTLESDLLDIVFEEQASEDGQAGGAALTGGASKIKTITSPGPVVLTRGTLERVTGLQAVFDIANDKALIDGDVVMAAGPERSAVAERAEISGGGSAILLTGNVNVKQGPNELKGGRLFIDRERGLSRMTSPAANGKAGRIFARLKRSEGDGDAGDKPAEASEGWAATAQQAAQSKGSLSATTFKRDPNAPTEITAVSLDVNDNSKQAIFSGDVEVRQGVIEMSAKRLVATYSGEASLVDATAAPAGDPAAPEGGGAELERIRAEGKVFINSKVDGQTASGDWADIDLVSNKVELGGDVALHQGQTIISANSLMIDMKTGNAIIQRTDDAPETGWSSTLTAGQGPQQKTTPLGDRGRGRRPSMVFYPSQIGKAKDKQAAGAKKKKKGKTRGKTADGPAAAAAPQTGGTRAATSIGPAASSWSTTVDE